MKRVRTIFFLIGLLLLVGSVFYFGLDWNIGHGIPALFPAAFSQNPVFLKEKDVIFTLRVGETKQLNDISVQLASIDSDSRCAQGEVCSPDGQVSLTLLVAQSSDSPNALVMRIPPRNSRILDAVGHYAFVLTKLEPESPVFGKKIAPEDYCATFMMREFR